MKKILLPLAMLAASAALAVTVQTANTYGVIKLTKLASEPQLVIACPWTAVGGGAISPAALVATTGLANGDHLFYYDGSAYKAWQLTDGAWTGVQTVADKNTGKPDASAPAEGFSVPQGAALIVQTSATDVYLTGQYSAIAESLSGPQLAQNAWNLIAPPQSEKAEIDINTDATWTGLKAGDEIVCNFKIYRWNGSAWTKEEIDNWGMKTRTSEGVTIPRGQGAWYHSTGATAPTVTWNAVSAN